PCLMLVSLVFAPYTATAELYALSLPTLFRSARQSGQPRTTPYRAALAANARRSPCPSRSAFRPPAQARCRPYASTARRHGRDHQDRKSTRLNSSHVAISYAVFCLKTTTTLAS